MDSTIDAEYGLRKEILKEIIRILVLRKQPKRIYLFGSRARGNFARTSDIDLALEGARKNDPFRNEMDESIRTLLSIDVVETHKIHKKFRKEILKEGKLIYEAR
ncbi:MAG: nucleotidyltransferase domain-containing protein [bacterium]